MLHHTVKWAFAGYVPVEDEALPLFQLEGAVREVRQDRARAEMHGHERRDNIEYLRAGLRKGEREQHSTRSSREARASKAKAKNERMFEIIAQVRLLEAQFDLKVQQLLTIEIARGTRLQEEMHAITAQLAVLRSEDTSLSLRMKHYVYKGLVVPYYSNI